MTSTTGELRTVTATATGRATGVPDLLTAEVGIANEGASAAEVLAENSRKTQGLIDALKGAGVDEADIATTSADLGPRYDRDGNADGFRATSSLQVKLRDLETAGAQLDSVVRIGGNDAQVHGLSLGFADDDALRSQARIDAIRRARAQAEEMAQAAGATVGEVRAITDAVTGEGSPYPMPSQRMFSMVDAAMPIAPGSQDLTVQVRVTFDLS